MPLSEVIKKKKKKKKITSVRDAAISEVIKKKKKKFASVRMPLKAK